MHQVNSEARNIILDTILGGKLYNKNLNIVEMTQIKLYQIISNFINTVMYFQYCQQLNHCSTIYFK